MLRRFALAALLPLALAACGDTNRDVIARYTPKVEAMRADLAKMAATLPAPGAAASGAAARAEPRPVYDAANGVFNTAFVPVEALSGAKPVYDLLLPSDLANALAWVSPANPMAESALDAPADGFAQQFDAALATPIVVLYRAAAYDPPRAIDDKNFEGGALVLEAFAFTRADSRMIGSCKVEAASAQNVSYTYKKGDDPRERLVAFAGSTLWEDTLQILSRCLGETTGGLFVFKRT